MIEDEFRKAATKALKPLRQWSKNCHAASLALVRAGLGDRVARGFCRGVPGQHSWVVVGMNCYDREATIIDPTLWSYDKQVRGVWVGTMEDNRHVPHGNGLIWDWGRPRHQGGLDVVLTPENPFSDGARQFIELLGPLDYAGWAKLAHAPVQGWPAGEILAAITNTAGLSSLVPIDRIGMTTLLNPGGIYLRTAAKDAALNPRKKIIRASGKPGGLDEDVVLLTCPECGNEQVDMGKHILCEQCGEGIPE